MNGLAGVISVPGYDFLAGAPRTWAGVMFLTLEDWGKRAPSSFDLVDQAFGLGAQLPDARIIALLRKDVWWMPNWSGHRGESQA